MKSFFILFLFRYSLIAFPLPNFFKRICLFFHFFCIRQRCFGKGITAKKSRQFRQAFFVCHFPNVREGHVIRTALLDDEMHIRHSCDLG